MNFRRRPRVVAAIVSVGGENSISRNYIVMIRIGSVLTPRRLGSFIIYYLLYTFYYYFAETRITQCARKTVIQHIGRYNNIIVLLVHRHTHIYYL